MLYNCVALGKFHRLLVFVYFYYYFVQKTKNQFFEKASTYVDIYVRTYICLVNFIDARSVNISRLLITILHIYIPNI